MIFCFKFMSSFLSSYALKLMPKPVTPSFSRPEDFLTRISAVNLAV